jgi:positive regulator of sigma E activity
MVITVVIPAAASAWSAGALIDILEDLSGATQTTRYQVHLAAPLTPGQAVTVSVAANPLLVSCEAVGVVNTIGASSLLLPRPEAPTWPPPL